jgi:type VI secretion system secreted protein VgrG
MPATQSNRQVSVKTALADDVLLFANMHGAEMLGRLSEWTVTMESENHNIQIADVLGKPLDVVLVTADGAGKRYFNGVVTRFGHTGSNNNFSIYSATVRPGLWLLSRASNCRIFQDMSVPDIIKQVCGDYGSDVVLDQSGLSQDHPVLPYCVQYRETDLDFVCRLMEQSGIYFYFTHTSGRHTTMLADSWTTHAAIPGYATMQVASTRDKEAFGSWGVSGAITTSKYDVNDFDFEKAASSAAGGMRATATIPAAYDQASYAMYDYPGKYAIADDGGGIAKARLESEHGAGEEITAVANARGLYPGGLFTLVEHPRDEANKTYLVTAATYAITGDDYASGDRAFSFACNLTAIGREHAFRPRRTVRQPVVQGPQTAMVVGKSGEEIWTDKYGRVKVQFHWDREGKQDENSSCWVRVAQGWAGKGWGAMAVPRIGMEVVVSFLEGDPDRPLVTGCVYNGDAMPPYPLPANQTVFTVKSQSSTGGEGFNELRFEDKKGKEEVFMHAERDFLRVVKNNDALKVGFETADKGDQTVDIKNDQTITIGHDAIETITNNQTVTIKADQKLDVTGDQKVHVGKTIVIEAGTSIELKVGGSSIKIEAAKITIKSAEIEIAADASAKVSAGAMMDIKAGAPMTISGAIVKIN